MLYVHTLNNARNDSKDDSVVLLLFDFFKNPSKQRNRPVIELAQDRKLEAAIVTSNPWEEWFRLGEEISRNWQSNQTVLEILSEIRR